MTYPTPEEVKRIASECGIILDIGPDKTIRNTYFAYEDELHAFFLRAFELGKETQRDSGE